MITPVQKLLQQHLTVCLPLSSTEFTYLIGFGYFHDITSYNKTEREFSIPFRSRKLDLFNITERWLCSEYQFCVIFTPRFDHYAFEIGIEIR